MVLKSEKQEKLTVTQVQKDGTDERIQDNELNDLGKQIGGSRRQIWKSERRDGLSVTGNHC